MAYFKGRLGWIYWLLVVGLQTAANDIFLDLVFGNMLSGKYKQFILSWQKRFIVTHNYTLMASTFHFC